ncbi:pyridoxamine 5'-phosphate oxidase family protein [Aminobacter sp. NyZ550]|jgi:PPOX class probable FMN-dependent enzyme|uniref:pyridoxamine 5'-phosphate oxidase family protein n=1 Tax=unclassified Aminobacter TaxID=2644704 RepID=UPI0017809028|nr:MULTISPECIES: pyridoxamine 5'-phosphate oxidase family protein [unclassified Aminobacter]QOF69296.1 pyridoxamine 5'-phosphate oxidase family protein [Aminobacter sp. SR38]WAX96154.1 pyridoxamine 5'-phosphate oxidase family protein [Aminobacter sp. NyZ550]WMC96819.1 pyridoxamine 5'-phosphate oxidase family protein [Aminobacter aminovorans]
MEFITDREALRQHYRAPGDGAVRKELRRLDHHAKGFLARSPFVLIGSSDDKGNADVTPKGDKPGFVAILDDATIAIPDRPGNNRLDTLENVIVNPAVGLLFLIPGMNETLRINGDARLTADPALCERLAAEGKLPVTVMVVAIKAVYMHCAKAFMRSELWVSGTWPDRTSLPTLGQILRDQLVLADNAETLDRSLDESYRKSMW